MKIKRIKYGHPLISRLRLKHISNFEGPLKKLFDQDIETGTRSPRFFLFSLNLFIYGKLPGGHSIFSDQLQNIDTTV